MPKTNSKRDARGRFIKAVKLAPAPVSTLWLPDARWVAPSAADRALARTVVAAADARIAATVSAEQAARDLADCAARDAADAIPEPRNWVDVCGKALLAAIILIPIAMGCVHVATHRPRHTDPAVVLPEPDAISGAAIAVR